MWHLLRLVSVAWRNKPQTMSSLAVPYTVPQAGHTVCMFWMTIQPNGCSTPAPTYSPGAPPQHRGGKRHRPLAPERGEKKENETKIKLETKKKKKFHELRWIVFRSIMFYRWLNWSFWPWVLYGNVSKSTMISPILPHLTRVH